MSIRDQVAIANQRVWEEEVKRGCGCCIPWLDLDVSSLRQYADGKQEFLPVPEPLNYIYPASILAHIEGQDVLCLASGGGQQSAVFGLLGARVTVLDFCEGQLAGDRKAAEHYGYDVTTIQGDMRDLSELADNSFDLVYGTGTAYVPDVREVFVGVARVIRAGGIYRADFWNPYTEFVDCTDWDGVGYRITTPHAQKERRRPDGMIEFRNYLDEVFNGLLDTGFSIERVSVLPRTLPDPKDEPGSYRHCDAFMHWAYAVLARMGEGPS
ncbi:MAG TPA: class I SAM-dependent methyltransferase [Candidatus Hydrogenedentes bacterium]|nr:class I SAM-dependent methyltransferase [Candidatus Hydrogenedentota bacterium]